MEKNKIPQPWGPENSVKAFRIITRLLISSISLGIIGVILIISFSITDDFIGIIFSFTIGGFALLLALATGPVHFYARHRSQAWAKWKEKNDKERD